jgi:hypothetical protein
MKARPIIPRVHIRVKVPFVFEAEGEGLASILCVAGLCALAILLSFLLFGVLGVR